MALPSVPALAVGSRYSADVVSVLQLSGGGQEEPRGEAGALTLPTFSTP